MKNLLELKAQLKVKRERFDSFRIENFTENIIQQTAKLNIKDKIKGKIQETIQEKVGEMKRFNRTMKQGYFTRQRTVRSYKAMI